MCRFSIPSNIYSSLVNSFYGHMSIWSLFKNQIAVVDQVVKAAISSSSHRSHDALKINGALAQFESRYRRIQYFMLTDIITFIRAFILCVPYFIRFMTVVGNVIIYIFKHIANGIQTLLFKIYSFKLVLMVENLTWFRRNSRGCRLYVCQYFISGRSRIIK